MHARLVALARDFTFTSDIAGDAPTFLNCHGCPKTAEHSARVANAAESLARRFSVNPAKAGLAGWLHDISAVISVSDRLQAARDLGLPVLPEEAAFPLIIHQKLSAVLARRLFKVNDPAVLAAISCHTTLRTDSSPLDRVLFVADKLEWDGQDAAPYRLRLERALAVSLEAAVLCYLDWLRERRDTLRVVHPWLREAYAELSGQEW